jgi:hypothetical protein
MNPEQRTNEIMALLTECHQLPKDIQEYIRMTLWDCLINNTEENAEVVDKIIDKIKTYLLTL